MKAAPPLDLYLLRHSNATERAPHGGGDAERPLTEEGAAKALVIGRALVALGLKFDLVLSSPALELGLGGGQRLLLALLGALAPDVRLSNGLKPEWVSRDGGVVAAYRGDPLNHDRITPRLVRFMLEAGARVRERAAEWTVPTLVMWAGADRLVVPAGSAAFAAAAPADRVQAREWPALFHEILNEPERAQVLGVLTGWLSRLAP